MSSNVVHGVTEILVVGIRTVGSNHGYGPAADARSLRDAVDLVAVGGGVFVEVSIYI